MPRKKRTLSKAKKEKSKKTNKLESVVYDLSGKEKDKIVLPKEIFDVTCSPKLLAQYVRVYLANNRQGTASTKSRGEVAGSTRKIYSQKHTGRARHGDIKAPIFVGGGVAHGPKPRDYSLSLTKKQKRKALFASLSEKFKKGAIYFIEGLKEIKPKVKEFLKLLRNLKLDKEKSILVIYSPNSKNLILSSRNLENINLCFIGSLNAYEILKAKKIIFPVEGLEILKKTYGIK